MRKEMDRALVKGFLKASGKNVVNGNGDVVLLNGWGLGNWLLCEGYMWLSPQNERFDRPRRIEAVVRELTGSAFSEYFWKEFRARYTTKEDIRLMAELGYNSVRIPFNWRILLEDEPGLNWIEEGFTLLDNCIDWCEEYGLYAFLDMHGAPGGQTGANIDDAVEELPRLFMDQDSWDKALAIWEKLAIRYADRWIVGGYDLLNEPIRPGRPGIVDCDHLVPELVRFYDEAIALIRKHDRKHMFSIEGHHWASTAALFTKRFDDNMVIHFHRYGCPPELHIFKEFLDTSERLNQPLWLGETGENILEWFSAVFPMAADLGIGYNLWPWKKMDTKNSPLSVHKPAQWEKIIEYTKGGLRPSYAEAQAILQEYLDNMLVQNCTHNTNVTWHCLRQPGCIVRGTDFDLFPGKGISYNGAHTDENSPSYRSDTGMCIKTVKVKEKEFFFDCCWDAFALELAQDEFAVYTLYDSTGQNTVSLELTVKEDAIVEIANENELLGTLELHASENIIITKGILLPQADKVLVKVTVRKGVVHLHRVVF
ncbi:MAG: glycoside hydrolase family 5 protein [Treponema sp.]|nr:glycoside hydrolase family 5 protein [Treponema sp.]